MTGLVALFESPAFLFTFAAIQAAVLLVGIRYLDVYGRQPLGLVALVAAWGATGAAGLSVIGNESVRNLLSGDVATVFGDAISAPLVEESAKGIALLVAVGPVRMMLRRAGVSLFEGAGAGVVYGAAVGLGFGFTEDVYYLVDTARSVGFDAGVDTFLYRRDFFGPATLHHAIFTGAFGAALGMATWTTSRWRKVLYPAGGFALAVLMHATNNGLVEVVLSVKYGLPETAAWVFDPAALPSMEETAGVVRRLMRAIDFFYVAAFFWVIVAWTRRQRDLVRHGLEDEVEHGVLHRKDLAFMFETRQRLAADWRLVRTGQFERLRHQRRLRAELGQLGMLKWRTERFGADVARVNRARRAVATLSTYEVVPVRLPDPASPLIGRERELAAIAAALGGQAARVLTLLGPGGTGKTRLAIEAASTERDLFSGGVYFVDLAPLSDPDLVPQAIAEVLDVHARSGESVVAALGNHLRDKQLLLVLDNVEQVTGAAPLVAEILRTAGRVKVLATSRQPLGISGEHELPIPPLDLPAPEDRDLAVLTANPAMALFVDRARSVDPAFALTPANAAAVAEICIGMDGLPLAIELAAARTNVLTPQAIRDRLGGRLGILNAGARDLPARHQALRSTIDWSYDLLTASEKTLFIRLGVFVDGASIEAVEAVCLDGTGGALDGLASLRDKSLVRRTELAGGEPRFAMLQTIREYAVDRLGADGSVDVVRERHARYFTEFAEAAEPELGGADQAVWVERLGREVGNLRASWLWSEESGQLELGMRTVGALTRFWSMRGLSDPSAWLSEALGGTAPISPGVRAKALFSDGYAALDHGDLARAESCFERSADLYRELSDHRGAAASLAQLAFLLISRGEVDRAVELAQESATVARELGDPGLESVALGTLADAAARRDDQEQATALYERSLDLRRQIGDRRNVANALLNLGRVAMVAGLLGRAREQLDQGLAAAEEIGDSWSISVGLASLGRLALAEGRSADGSAMLRQALARAVERGGQRLAVECLIALGAAEAPGSPSRAAELFGAAEAIRRTLGAELSPVEVPSTQSSVDQVRASLGDQDFLRHWNAGLARSLGDVVALASPEATQFVELLGPDHARRIAAVMLEAIRDGGEPRAEFVGRPALIAGGWLYRHNAGGTGPVAIFVDGRVQVLDAETPVAAQVERAD